MTWEQLETVTNHLGGSLARIVLYDQQEARAEVIVPDSAMTHYIYILEDSAHLVKRINSMFELPVAECSLVDGELILN